MAKKAKKAETTEKKKVTAKERNSIVKNNYIILNDMDGIKTEVMYIREQGCLVRESSKVGICSSFIPNVKPKKKGVNYVLIQDTAEMRAKKAEKRAAKKASTGKTKSKKK